MNSVFKILTGLCAVMTISSCSKFLDVNKNPNAPVNENLPLSAKLPAALVSSVNQEAGQLNQLGAFWAGYWGTTSEGVNLFFKEKNYDGPAIRHQRDGIPVWENAYATLLYYQLIREQAVKENALFYAGVAKIMQGWHFLRLVDVYNNLPFDDALQGTVHPRPRYEDGKAVYAKSVDLITAGINDVKNALPGTEAKTDDVLFNGSRVSWARFGNTIKLRALVRQSEAGDAAYITAEMAKIAAEGSGFLGAGEHADVNPGYLVSAGKMNPFWETYYRNVQGAATGNLLDLRPTQYAVDQYASRNDPRLPQLYVALGGGYKGVLFGNPNAEEQYNRANTSAFKGPVENGNQPGAVFKSQVQAAMLMGSFESLFLQAEAAQRGWLQGASAQLLYEEAIRESFKYMGVNGSLFSAYNSQPAVDFAQAANKIARIAEQKWLALNSISGIEAWAEYRRLGVPAIPNSLDAPAPDARPLRLMYPETERQSNGEEAAKQGSDNITTAPVWWDK
ncbi:SusD/RagB family nutrient-binding outer membrane lipoprotein [Chitinophaga sp.]|uniref:SusD/RagB family nutrient-binding outer membrane lipoprotein n=1 Tax=Chitinophaga sp. TaxID=1869181 RepID=UPI0031CFF2AA